MKKKQERHALLRDMTISEESQLSLQSSFPEKLLIHRRNTEATNNNNYCQVHSLVADRPAVVVGYGGLQKQVVRAAHLRAAASQREKKFGVFYPDLSSIQ